MGTALRTTQTDGNTNEDKAEESPPSISWGPSVRCGRGWSIKVPFSSGSFLRMVGGGMVVRYLHEDTDMIIDWRLLLGPDSAGRDCKRKVGSGL